MNVSFRLRKTGELRNLRYRFEMKVFDRSLRVDYLHLPPHCFCVDVHGRKAVAKMMSSLENVVSKDLRPVRAGQGLLVIADVEVDRIFFLHTVCRTGEIRDHHSAL